MTVNDTGTCRDCALKENCAEYKENKSQCEDYESYNEVMTNEEWLKSLDTEGLVDYLYEVFKGGNTVERQFWIEKHKERFKMQFRGWLKGEHHDSVQG